MATLIASLRITGVTLLVCVGAYAGVLLGLAQLVTPESADGHLVATPDGRVVGSRLIAQAFSDPGHFWPRPSAVGYNGAGAGGSNKSPTSPDLTARAEELVAIYGATASNPLPPELVAASGGGLDPHISERAALYQAPRVADARGVALASVQGVIDQYAFFTGGRVLTPERIVNVLELNLALDALAATGP